MARTASRSERFEANRRRRLLGRDRAKRAAPACCLAGEGVKGNGSLDSSPNFRGASALLRGTSQTCGPKRGIRRDAPSVCLTGEGSVPPPRRPLPSGLGAAFFPKPKFYSIFFKKLRGRGAAPSTRSALRAAAKRFERNPPKAGSWREMSAERFLL